MQAEGDAEDVGCIGLENNGAATAVQHHARLLRRRSGGEEQDQHNRTRKPLKHVHLPISRSDYAAPDWGQEQDGLDM